MFVGKKIYYAHRHETTLAHMSSAINMFLRSAINHNGIPFEIKCLTPNAKTRAALDEYEEMKKNPGNYMRYESFGDVLDEVFADA